jgi:hypothetical protein
MFRVWPKKCFKTTVDGGDNARLGLPTGPELNFKQPILITFFRPNFFKKNVKNGIKIHPRDRAKGLSVKTVVFCMGVAVEAINTSVSLFF